MQSSGSPQHPLTISAWTGMWGQKLLSVFNLPRVPPPLAGHPLTGALMNNLFPVRVILKRLRIYLSLLLTNEFHFIAVCLEECPFHIQRENFSLMMTMKKRQILEPVRYVGFMYRLLKLGVAIIGWVADPLYRFADLQGISKVRYCTDWQIQVVPKKCIPWSVYLSPTIHRINACPPMH